MELAILRDEEKRMNFIMFLFNLAIPVVAFFYVLLFNGGGPVSYTHIRAHETSV